LTFAIGLTYPLAVRVLAADAADAALAAARVYSWNTVGAIVGALAGGFLLIPALRYEGAIRCAVVASLLLAFGAASLLLPLRKAWSAALLALPVAAFLLFHPAEPEALLRVSPLRGATGQLLYYGVGRSADVVVMREDNLLGLRTNGLPEAASSIKGALLTSGVEAWMPAVAVLARPDTARMLVVGYGGGNVLQAVPPSVRSIDVIELEPQVIAANRALAKLRAQDPLRDSRINLVLNDARGALNLSDARYDAIVSQPSHPWTAGASHLYTREFIQQAHDHLNPGGVYVQWMSTEYLDESLLRSMFATLAAVFPETRVYRTAPTTLMMMGSDQPIEPERNPAAVQRVLDSASLHYARIGLQAPEDLVAALALDDAGVRSLAAGEPLITDDDNRLAMSARFNRGNGLRARDIDALFEPYDPLTHADSFIHREIASQLDFGYIWRRLALAATPQNRQGLERLMRLADALGDSPRAVQLRYMMAMRLKQPDIARQLLADGVARWPDDGVLRYLSVEPELADLARDAGSPAARASLARLPAEAQLVFSGVVAATHQQWDQLRALDAQLSQVSWTAPWGLEAAQLRCEWRVRVKNPELRQEVGDEGIAIADRALNTEPDIFWYSLRAWSAVGTGRPEVELESIAGFAETLNGIARDMTPQEKALARERAQGLKPLLEQLGSEAALDPVRLQEVRDKMARALAALG
ncbi:MAG TPA: fused MFS/spermidine synthase, partial [Steroidobacteraceae bacterium]|nr:fused MFS/spermidine synthase [Steroidobacteraceae bacterium]